MIIEVQNKSFEIGFVNNYVHELYTKMVNKISDIATQPNEISELIIEQKEKVKDIVNSIQIIKINKEYHKKMRDIELKAREMAKETVAYRQEIIKEVLETNNYVYDEQWWLRKTSTEDCNDFMQTCIKKDYKPSGSSVKKKSSIGTD